MSVPSWVADAIFYQIFPDRFENGDISNDPPNVKPWGSAPVSHGFQGGDLAGISKRLDYLSELGINAIYLNPIFLSTSTHRYNATDYYQIDDKLGTLNDFKTFLKITHERKIRVVLDGVFNHCGRGFFAFADLMENQENSGYKDWFFVKKFPINAYSSGKATEYAGWWDHKSLPKLNTYNPRVKKYIMDVARYWIDLGIDGWRLDVPNEINDDAFWGEFRQIVKTANPEAYLVGEIWTVDPRWVGETHFDGLMNYPVRGSIIDLLLGKINCLEFVNNLHSIYSAYTCENSLAMYNLLGSHDTERILTVLNNDPVRTKLAQDILFTLPGAPAIYYGDEIGLTGGKDPDCRKAFNWNKSAWNMDIHEAVKKNVKSRKEIETLRKGTLDKVSTDGQSVVGVFSRKLNKEINLIAINPSRERQKARVNLSGSSLESTRQVWSYSRNMLIQVNGQTLDFDVEPMSLELLQIKGN